ncbi:MAG: alpha/beta hydrolase [Candidatus Binatia bacterium]
MSMPTPRTVSWLFLAVSVWGAWFTYNGFRPRYRGGRLAVVSFFAGWLTTELALHHVAWQAAFTVGFVWLGALSAWPGWVGLGITLVSWAGLLRCFLGARDAERVVERALREGLGADYEQRIAPDVSAHFAPGVQWSQLLVPMPVRHPEVERIPDIVYAEHGGVKLRLDVYRRRERPVGCPTLLQIHGGGWVLGSKNEQGLPLMMHLASRGWVCATANYRLAPRATFPDPLIDLKAAIRWLREHGPEYGADPDFLVVTGGSAGGHLCALVALTANDPAYQPGFEHVDTHVDGCVSFYGVYDFVDEARNWPHGGLRDLLETQVMKSSPHTDRSAWERASPIYRVHEHAPPFLVIHGDKDTMVPVAEARRFAQALREHTPGPVVYAEIPGAQHAFEIFPSLRTTFVLHGVERFLAHLYSQHRASRRPAAIAVGGGRQ